MDPLGTRRRSLRWRQSRFPLRPAEGGARVRSPPQGPVLPRRIGAPAGDRVVTDEAPQWCPATACRPHASSIGGDDHPPLPASRAPLQAQAAPSPGTSSSKRLVPFPTHRAPAGAFRMLQAVLLSPAPASTGEPARARLSAVDPRRDAEQGGPEDSPCVLRDPQHCIEPRSAAPGPPRDVGRNVPRAGSNRFRPSGARPESAPYFFEQCDTLSGTGCPGCAGRDGGG